MRARLAFSAAAALLVLTICASCGGGGGGGGSAGGAGAAPDTRAPANVALTWSGNDEVVGYVVHWGTAPREYSNEVDVRKPAADSHGQVTVVVALDAGARSATQYFFAITSYDAAGESSDYSNELSIDTSALS